VCDLDPYRHLESFIKPVLKQNMPEQLLLYGQVCIELIVELSMSECTLISAASAESGFVVCIWPASAYNHTLVDW
jgi:hypothetical protein